MSPTEEMPSELERRLRDLLEESVAHVDGRIRSRLNQARQAALAQTARRRPFLARPFVLMPAGALAAAALAAFVLWPRSPQTELSLPTLSLTADNPHATVEDLDLLADSEGLDMVSSEESDGFFEWALDQTETSETST